MMNELSWCVLIHFDTFWWIN